MSDKRFNTPDPDTVVEKLLGIDKDEMPDVIYANTYPHRSDSGMWFDKRVNHPAMPQEPFIKASKAKQDKLDLLEKCLRIIHSHSSPGHAYREVKKLRQEIEDE